MSKDDLYEKKEYIWISDEIFEKALSNINPYNEDKLKEFWNWLENATPYKPDEVSENGFYFSVVSRCLILHGYGEPFLDKFLIKRLKKCKENKIPTYFSCTPATMTVEKAVAAMENGLSVLKFSLDAMDDDEIKKIRGRKANYNESIRKILEIIKIKKERNFKTILVPCMISFKNSEKDKKLHKSFLEFWKPYDVFAYVKSQDNRWLFEKDKDLVNNYITLNNIVNIHGHP